MKLWPDYYFDHYTAFFGEFVTREIFNGPNADDPSIEILSYDQVFKNCRVFASLGLSHYAKNLESTLEVIVPCEDHFEDTSEIIAQALFYAVTAPVLLAPGATISGISEINPLFAERFGKHSLYFHNPLFLPEVFCNVETALGEARVLSGMFISAKEHDYLDDHGRDKFELLLETEKVDPFVLRRASVA